MKTSRASGFLPEALLFLFLAGTVHSLAEDLPLPAKLYLEKEWSACAIECRRGLCRNQDDFALRLLRAMALVRSGSDATKQLLDICGSEQAPVEVSALANYELGRIYWSRGQYEDAFYCLEKAYRSTESRELFSCSSYLLNTLTSRYPEMADKTPELKLQLLTCAPLWSKAVRDACSIKSTHRQNAFSGMPAQWAIKFYGSQISPAIGQRCSLHPSCSAYAMQALRRYGLPGLALYGDRAVREPDVVAAAESPVLIDGSLKHRDDLEDHALWKTEKRKTAGQPHMFSTVSMIFMTGNPGTNEGKNISDEPPHRLAASLANDGNHGIAALEFRRLAQQTNDHDAAAAYLWMAAYEYIHAEKYRLAMKMLDRAELLTDDITNETLLLRAEAEAQNRNLDESEFYLRAISPDGIPENMKNIIARKRARLDIMRNRPGKARSVLAESQIEDKAMLSAISRFQAGRNKSPTLGGLLGIVPGLGYAYSHEYANALRSLILNGIFIYAMAETADDNDWGAFTAITFFEITWYTGSIYGGIDSAQRHNERRVSACADAVMDSQGFSPDTEVLPRLSLKFRF